MLVIQTQKFDAISDGRIQWQEVIQTILWNTLHNRFDRRCRVSPHFYITPKSQTKYPGIQRFQPL